MDNFVLRTQLSILSTFTAYEAGSVLGAALLLGGSEVEGDAGLSAQALGAHSDTRMQSCGTT